MATSWMKTIQGTFLLVLKEYPMMLMPHLLYRHQIIVERRKLTSLKVFVLISPLNSLHILLKPCAASHITL